jgi:hypothetical protein
MSKIIEELDKLDKMYFGGFFGTEENTENKTEMIKPWNDVPKNW